METGDITLVQRFMLFAEMEALVSPAPRTRVGAVIVDLHSMTIVSSGHNSIPRNVDASRPERLEQPDELHFFAHAEENAIVNAARTGRSVADCVMLVTHMPCSTCARMIVNAGLRAVYVPETRMDLGPVKAERYRFDVTHALFEEGGVRLIPVSSSFHAKISQV